MTARLMRRVVIDVVRARRADTRDGAAIAVTFDERLIPAYSRPPDPIALDDALDTLTRSTRGRHTSSNCGSSAD